DWLVKHVSNNNGKVGMFGVSYDGLTSALALLQPHPALKAISEQASPADEWMNDAVHHYGALRESYAFEYAVMEQSDKNKNYNFVFDVYDTYSWYLKLGPLSNINARYLNNSIPHWNDIVAGPWFHGQWRTLKADSIGLITFGGHETAREFRENIETPFFRYYLHG